MKKMNILLSTIHSLQNVAHNLIKNHGFVFPGDQDVFGSEFSETAYPKLLESAKSFVQGEGALTGGHGWVFQLANPSDSIEVLIVETADRKFIPSVSSDFWEAKANCIDDSLAKDTQAEALAWGLTDALSHYFSVTEALETVS